MVTTCSVAGLCSYIHCMFRKLIDVKEIYGHFMLCAGSECPKQCSLIFVMVSQRVTHTSRGHPTPPAFQVSPQFGR
jgi:hypothetical protein